MSSFLVSSSSLHFIVFFVTKHLLVLLNLISLSSPLHSYYHLPSYLTPLELHPSLLLSPATYGVGGGATSLSTESVMNFAKAAGAFTHSNAEVRDSAKVKVLSYLILSCDILPLFNVILCLVSVLHIILQIYCFLDMF
jgi:hypothetical protein